MLALLCILWFVPIKTERTNWGSCDILAQEVSLHLLYGDTIEKAKDEYRNDCYDYIFKLYVL